MFIGRILTANQNEFLPLETIIVFFPHYPYFSFRALFVQTLFVQALFVQALFVQVVFVQGMSHAHET